jgi:ABC-type Co2+ transport system permease subunit
MLLFVLVCALGGVGALLGSILGHFVGRSGLYSGAMVGGVVGVYVATRIARARRILGVKRFWPATIGGWLGFVLAAIIAANHLDTPVIPIASVLLIGLGAVFGAASRHGKSITD